MNEITTLTADGNLATFLLVLVALAGLFILFSNVVEACRKLRKPQNAKEESLIIHQEECARRFANDKKTLEAHEKRIESLEEGQVVQCTALHALLEHAIHNGNTAEMEAASKTLFDYLNKR